MMNTAPRFADEIVSPLEGVSPRLWRRFVSALSTQHESIARGGALGIYNIRPRRLVEIGRAVNFRRVNGKQLCDFVLPWTQKRFLVDPVAQYAVLVKSMRLYYDALREGAIEKPESISMAGALAILHSGGRGALEATFFQVAGWPDLFDGTKALYEVTKGLF